MYDQLCQKFLYLGPYCSILVDSNSTHVFSSSFARSGVHDLEVRPSLAHKHTNVLLSIDFPAAFFNWINQKLTSESGNFQNCDRFLYHSTAFLLKFCSYNILYGFPDENSLCKTSPFEAFLLQAFFYPLLHFIG